MNIIFILQSNPFYNNSAFGNRYKGIINGLLRCGNHITLVITDGYCSESEKVNNGYQSSWKDRDVFNVYYTLKLDSSNIWFKRANLYFLSRFVMRINSALLMPYFRKQYDYYFIGNDLTSLYAYNKNSKKISINSVIEINEFDDIFLYQKLNFFQRSRSKLYRKEFEKAIKRINCFAFMTKALLEHYKPRINREAKLFHLPMTVEMSRFSKKEKDTTCSKPYIAYTGTFSNAKDGVDILIKSFAKIANKYPQYHLYLAGFWHYDVSMQEELIEKFGLKHRITYLGVLNKDQIPAFVCNADLLVLSRPDSHQAPGGFPTNLGEYLATGNPVCVTKVGEIPDYLEDNVSAFMATPGDVDSFADAMDRALSNPDNAKRVGLTGLQVAQREFNSEIQAKRLSEFLKQNLEKRL